MKLSMGCSQNLSVRPEQRLSVGLRLTVKQRLAVQTQKLKLRLELLQVVRAERYEPHAVCPRCTRRLTPLEILHGFNRDPNDYTTKCPNCGHRFAPQLISFGEGSRMELPFLCGAQTLAQLPGLEMIPQSGLKRTSPSIYHSALYHFGSLKSAFKKIGVDYRCEEVADWRDKIRPFLGKLPDTVIAVCADVSPSAIRRMRAKLKISACRVHKTLHELKKKK
jgi:hypothetical protein